MKQVVQNLRGDVRLTEVPAPALRPGGVLVRTVCSVLSPGTERTNVERSRRSILSKAKDRPDLVRQVIQRMRRDGWSATMRSVNDRLDALVPMGYSSAGVVEAVGEGVRDLRVGDRVACAGGGFASHAELVWVPQLLCARVPAGGPREIPLGDAAFATLGAIALQGFRQGELRLGETVAVTGLGLLGLLTVQLAKAAGCRVVAADLDPDRIALALRLGADVAVPAGEEYETAVRQATAGRGADAVLITAATESAEPVRQAGRLARDRAVVVVVGAVPADVPRSPFYEKEVDVRFSRSYGPGRYDPSYEEHGHDYPIGYVRWSEQRNLEAFLDLLGQGRLDLKPLVSHRFPIAEAERAYQVLTDPDARALAIVLDYPEAVARTTRVDLAPEPARAGPAPAAQVRIGVIGASGFARAVMIPALKEVPDVTLRGMAAANGLNARSAATQAGFEYCTSDYRDLLADSEIDVVMIATRHGLHAEQTVAALEAGKRVFVEKPLCLTEEELDRIVAAWKAAGRPAAMVGFNRRFSPHTAKVRPLFAGRRDPLSVHYRINAGQLPAGSWINDPVEGGGRVLGEVCHFVDLSSALVGAQPVHVFAESVGPDGVAATLRYPDGSVAMLQYLSGGHPKVPKERIEIVGAGTVALIDDFQTTTWQGPGGEGKFAPGGQDKGHRAEFAAFARAVREGKAEPLSFGECAGSTLATLRIRDSAAGGVGLSIEAIGLGAEPA
ncbi:MAG TPA: bi-domain-containing oxidoreductase [Gemmatimonadales bacterium]|nr:bi-domain-containing oxidoreductase [Gemmatimonadales bacterium]